MYGMAQPIAFERIVRPSTVFELAVMNGLSLRGKGTQHHLTAALRHLPPANIDQFLRKFIDVNTVLCGNLDAIERVSFEFLEDAQKDKLTNLEVELWPFTLLQQDDYSIFVDDVVSAVLKGFERGYKMFGVKARLNLLTTVDPPVSSVAPFDVSVMDGAYLQSEDMAHNTEERSLATVGSSSESFVVLDQTYKSFPEDKLMLSITSDEVQTASYHAFSVMQANCAIINSLVSELLPMQDNMEENVTQTTLDHDCGGCRAQDHGPQQGEQRQLQGHHRPHSPQPFG